MQGYVWILWALLALCCYGGNNFLVNAVAEEADEKTQANVSAMFMVWAVAGLAGLLMLAREAASGDGPVLSDGRGRGGALSALAGVMACCATMILSAGLAVDPDSAGPIVAMLPLNSILVCVIAWIFLEERLSTQHMVGTAIAVAGPVLMALADTSSAALSGLAFGLGAALFFGLSNALRKVVRRYGTNNQTVMTIMFLTIAVVSVIAVGGSYAIGRGLRGIDSSPKLMGFALGSGALWVVGSLCFQAAMAKGLAGPASAIANVNSAVVLVLDIIFFNPSLKALKLVGMGVCLLGVTVISLAPRPAPAPAPDADPEGPPAHVTPEQAERDARLPLIQYP